MSDTSAEQGSSVRCRDCDRELDASFSREPRPPCPSCGSIVRSFGITCEGGQIQVKGAQVNAELSPNNQVRDWRQRWETIQAYADKITRPSSEPLNRDTIAQRRNELQTFYVQCYHLKDALRKELPNAVTDNAVEHAITASQTLALLADLANLEKHALPGQRHAPRSGSWPAFEGVTGRTCAAGGWNIVLKIRHGQTILDGLEVAEQAVVAWRKVLTGFGLI